MAYIYIFMTNNAEIQTKASALSEVVADELFSTSFSLT